MSNLTTNVADGGNRRTAWPREVFNHQYCLTYIETPSLSTFSSAIGSRLDFNFERAVGGSILTAGKKYEKSECNNSGYKLTGGRDGLGKC